MGLRGQDTYPTRPIGPSASDRYPCPRPNRGVANCLGRRPSGLAADRARQPEPQMDAIATRSGPLERATALQPLISEDALEGERLGHLTDRVGTALLDAGLIQILVPERLGGLGASRRDFFDAVEAIAFADGSAG